MTTSVFNPIENMQGAIKAGFTRDQAEYQANEMAKIINNALVTKSFLASELKTFREEMTSMELRMTIKLGSIMLTGIGLMTFLLKHI